MSLATLGLDAQTRRWTVNDGLPTNEVRQIVELPNGQMLVGCEGLYCLTLGETFVPVTCDRTRAVHLKRFATRYGHFWQGDSLLWLHDLYRIYLFDARTRSFRNDVAERMNTSFMKDFTEERIGFELNAGELWPAIDSLGLHGRSMTATKDRQGGLWIGTREEGIIYQPPQRMLPLTLHDDSLMLMARNANASKKLGRIGELPFRRINFTCDLPDGRVLIGHDMNRLSYHTPESNNFISIDIPELARFRNIVGAYPIDNAKTVIYSQNGIAMLMHQADTLAPFPPSRVIDPYTDKYNCMLCDNEGNLWVGTQNGLFLVSIPEYSCRRIEGMVNNCIRSLVMDADGHVWAGTSCGVSRVTPTVVNFGREEGIPSVSMMERAACLDNNGRLVFAHGSHCTIFRPEWLLNASVPLPVQLLEVSVFGEVRVFSCHTVVTLPYNENYLKLQFSTLDYAHTTPTRYRYRLTPLEAEWHECTAERGFATATYTALPHGEYTFEVQAAAPDSEWSASTRQRFVISPPFWLTWWAKAIYCLIALAFLTFLISVYLKKKRRQLERENDNRVNQLFERREEARHQFAENTNIDPEKIGVNPEEEALVSQLLKTIELHLSDSEYSVDQMAFDVAMSRSKLYDKMRNMLGISPADFIRNVRLKRSAQLLVNTTLTITEIAERVGFGTTRNFSQQFKKMFGMLPSEYRSPDKL